MQRTVNALVGRGLNLQLAEGLASQGFKLSTLQQMTKAKLTGLGISSEAADNILGGTRPPIPPDTVARVLYRNRFRCCVCHEPHKAIILHHIVPWATSRDHGESNLAALCLDHHAQAHSTTALAQNLDARNLASIKMQWEADCERFAARAILEASRLDHAAWLYFNHQRLLALADDLRIDLKTLVSYEGARATGLIDDYGAPITGSNQQTYIYHGGNGRLLYAYMRDVLHRVMGQISIVNMSDHLDRGAPMILLAPGDFLFVQGAHNFKKQNELGHGPGQISSGIRQANGVAIKYVFDRWEATSTSAWGLWLLGRQSVGSLVHVKTLAREDGQIVIQGTVLGISNGHSSLKARDYAPEVARLAAEHRPIDFDNLPPGWHADLDE